MGSITSNNAPLVTVAMVTYNSSKYVAMAIDSVLNSSYVNFELVICDDCSTDETWQIVQSYDDPRIVAKRNENNLREYPNRNQCIDLAKGEYLIFIDGDDVIYPHGLEFMTRMLMAFPDCGMALMRWFRNNVIYPVVITPEQFYIGEYLYDGFLGTAFSNVLFKTQVLREVGKLDNSFPAGDDLVRYRIATKYPSVVINDGLTWWRETPGQASQQLQKSQNFFFGNFRMKFEFLNSAQCPLNDHDKSSALTNLKIVLSRIAIKNLVKGQLRFAKQIMSEFDIAISELRLFRNAPLRKDPLGNHSPAEPAMISFAGNPFSPNFEKH